MSEHSSTIRAGGRAQGEGWEGYQWQCSCGARGPQDGSEASARAGWESHNWGAHSPAAPTNPAPSRPPGWYPDPEGKHQYRYWGGTDWTVIVADAGVRTSEGPRDREP
jgi:hypothetical protein